MSMTRSLLCALTVLLCSACQQASTPPPGGATLVSGGAGDCVVLLHGLGRTAHSMADIAASLALLGYSVWNESYPSRQQDILTLADTHVERGVQYCRTQGSASVHFVTHSMGGILVRQYLQDRRLDNQGRMVMLAPPNHGSELTDRFREQIWYAWILGPAAMELGTEAGSTPNSLKPVPGEIGVIAGTGSSAHWFGGLFDGEHDGKVSVQSARLEEMSDFLLVDKGHAAITRSDAVIAQVAHFLRSGVFQRIGGKYP